MSNKKSSHSNIQNKSNGKAQKSAWLDYLEGFIIIYMVIMAVVFPFYMTKGYSHIGSDKNIFFRYAGGIFSICILLFEMGYFLTYLVKNQFRLNIKEIFYHFSFTDRFALLYGIAVILSYLNSPYKDVAFFGRNGWYIGLVTQMIYLVIYFSVSRFFDGTKWVEYPYLATTFMVFGMGILNRFSVYPFGLKGNSSGFISTLGNINWFCSYWSVLFPIVSVFFLYKSQGKWWKQLIYGILFSVMTVAGAIQGSDSAGIVFAVVYLTLFYCSMGTIENLRKYFGMVCLGTGLMQAVRFVRFLFPEAINMETFMTDLLTQGNLTFVLMVIAGILYIGCTIYEKKCLPSDSFLKVWRYIRTFVFVLLGVGVVSYFILLVLNTTGKIYIASISENPWLIFNEAFGNDRGTTWRCGVKMYSEMPWIHKIFGVGPDCFASFAYRDGSLVQPMLEEVFGTAVLTNAHNEWLTVLVNIGLFGLISYIGFFISAIYRYLKNREISPWVFAGGLAVLSYTLHNMVSFQQALNGPIMFLVLGVTENAVRRKMGSRYVTEHAVTIGKEKK